MRKVKVAATQMSCSWNREEVLDKAEKLVRKAAAEGANIILLQELFETPYFCQKQKFEYFDLAKPLSEKDRKSSKTIYRGCKRTSGCSANQLL